MVWQRFATVCVCAVLGCSGSVSTAPQESSQEETSAIPPSYLPSWLAALEWFDWLKTNVPEAYTTSSAAEADSRPWGDGYDPTTDPIFAHNEIEISGATPTDVLAFMKKGRSDTYYPNSSAATDCATGEQVELELGTSYCWTTFGKVQQMTIMELVDDPSESVLAWEGGSLGVSVYHRWIMRATDGGTHVITEECERGTLPNIGLYRNRMNPSLHAGHELWLRGLRNELEPQP